MFVAIGLLLSSAVLTGFLTALLVNFLGILLSFTTYSLSSLYYYIPSTTIMLELWPI